MSDHKSGRSEMFLSPQIRGAYFFLHRLRTTDVDGKPLATGPRYEFVGLVPKTTNDASTCPNYGIFAKAATAAYQSSPSWHGQWPAGGNWPIEDGDADPTKLAKYPWRKGYWITKFSALETNPPTVQILQNGQRVDVPAQVVGTTEIYKSGDFCHASFSAFTYDNKSKGVKFDVKGVVFVAKGDAIGAARPTADQMFAGLPGAAGAPHPTPGAPGFALSMAPAAPVQPAPIAYPSNPPSMAPVYAPPPAPAAPVYATPQPGPALYAPPAPPAYPMAPPPAPGGYAPQAPAGLPPFPVPR